MGETRKIAAILVADIVGYSDSRGRMRIAHCRGCEGCEAI